MIRGFTFCLLVALCSSLYTDDHYSPQHGSDFHHGGLGRGYHGDNRHYGSGYGGRNKQIDNSYLNHIAGDNGYAKHIGLRGRGYGGHDNGIHKGRGYYAPAKYEFGYGVHDPYHGSDFGHKESRDGDLTRGEYYVNLPDGRLQKVSYYADEHGYHPTISYVGKAHFPSHGKGRGGEYY